MSTDDVEPARLLPRTEFRGAFLDALFHGIEAASALVIAVSGGPDSMALMRLAARWVEQATDNSGTRPELHVATVDHGLRHAAAADAAFVAAAAADLGLSCETLRWDGPKPATRIQERARDARYALLAAHARAVRAAHVLTAHHADDQAETVLMRLGRGSGVTGLSGMRRETELTKGVTLVRPFLHLSKAELGAFCRQEPMPYLEDPSNGDPAFARVRLRRQAGASAALGLDRSTLIRLGERMMRADVALQDASARLEAQLAPNLQPGCWSTSLAPISDVAPELLQRVLRRAIEHVLAQTPSTSVRPRRIRLDRLESLVNDLHVALHARQALRSTLGGTRIVLKADMSIQITLETTRRRGWPESRECGPAPPVNAELPRTPSSLGK